MIFKYPNLSNAHWQLCLYIIEVFVTLLEGGREGGYTLVRTALARSEKGDAHVVDANNDL